ncbi:MAG: ParB/RepB/Spo0J family partition protein [Lachnospiraceae bacterium]|nr:ParB/RepB/Spo0J family partition protein [Lachnospiraceae bacterium]
MSRSIAGKIKINSFADIVSGDDTAVTEVPISDLYEFKDHPFRVLDDEKMDETVESVKAYGVLVPGIVRPRPGGGYEIIAGHRRRRACELAGLETMPVIIKNMTDEEAVVAMVDINIQREDILPSEKAKAYRMKYDAMKHQGSEGGNTLEEIGEAAGESAKTVQRYLWMSRLNDCLMGMVDNRKLAVTAATDLSFLNEKEQELLAKTISEEEKKISTAQAARIKELSQEGNLNIVAIRKALESKREKTRKFVLKAESLTRYFDEDYSNDEIEDIIIGLLDNWAATSGHNVQK